MNIIFLGYFVVEEGVYYVMVGGLYFGGEGVGGDDEVSGGC